MTLAARLSTFFLISLLLVLCGFSAALYAVAHTYLERQTIGRLQSALGILAAAAELDRGAVEWEPHDRQLRFAAGSGTGQLEWRVIDERDATIDASDGAGLRPAPPLALATVGDSEGKDVVDELGHPWRVAEVRVVPPDAAGPVAPSPDQRRFGSLTIQAAISLEPMRATLRWLAWVVGGLSLAIWLAAAAMSRTIARRALRPLTAMAAAARQMRGEEPDKRLPDPATRDECQDLAVAFNELLARTQEAFERQRQFTAAASHELRTPLTAILSQVDVALRRDREPQEYRCVLQAASQRATNMRQLIEMLLYLARADRDSQLPDLHPTDVAVWLAEHLERWRSHPRFRDLSFDGSSPSGSASVHAALLAQLIDNLLDNACKYSAPGTSIDVRLRSDHADIVIEVEDHGCGIERADLPRVFEPFYRCARSRSEGVAGAGLGLAVAARIAAAHQGRLEIQSTLDEGTRVRLFLPKLSDQAESRRAELHAANQ